MNQDLKNNISSERAISVESLEKMRQLFDKESMLKHYSEDCRTAFRDGVKQCILILEKEYDIRYL